MPCNYRSTYTYISWMYRYTLVDCVLWDQRILGSFIWVSCCYRNQASTSEDTKLLSHSLNNTDMSHANIRRKSSRQSNSQAVLLWNSGMSYVQILENMVIIYGVELLLHICSWSRSLCTTSENLHKSAVLTHRLCDTMQKDVLAGSFSTCFHSMANTPGKSWNDPSHLYSAAWFTDAYLVSLTHLQGCICTCCTCTIW